MIDAANRSPQASASDSADLVWPVIATDPAPARDFRVLLIGQGPFRWLLLLQACAPSPRLDLRYLLDGILTELRLDPQREERWLETAHRVMADHVDLNPQSTWSNLPAGSPTSAQRNVGRHPAPAIEPTGTPHTRPVIALRRGLGRGYGRGRGQSAHVIAGADRAGEQGTVDAQTAGEGVDAQSSAILAQSKGTPPVAAGARPPLPQWSDHCRALHIGVPTFQWLKAVQGTTDAPRLAMRFLVEGGLALARSDRHWLPRAIDHGRAALADHLAALRDHPATPHFLESLP